MTTETLGAAGRIDEIESAYEFMLAYAAQGKRGTEGGPASEIRGYLSRFVKALDGLAETAAQEVEAAASASQPAMTAFRETLEADAAHARAVLSLALAQPAISSQMVDNLNASIHVRTVLTDLFLLDSVLPNPSVR